MKIVKNFVVTGIAATTMLAVASAALSIWKRNNPDGVGVFDSLAATTVRKIAKTQTLRREREIEAFVSPVHSAPRETSGFFIPNGQFRRMVGGRYLGRDTYKAPPVNNTSTASLFLRLMLRGMMTRMGTSTMHTSMKAFPAP